MAEFETVKFPYSTPEDAKAAAEKALNLWVGMLSPMWVPFWAASSFGVAAWTVAQGLDKTTGFYKDRPLKAWGGLKLMSDEAERTTATAVKIEETAAAELEADTGDVLASVETVVDPVVETLIAVPVIKPLAAKPVDVTPKPVAKSLAVAKSVAVKPAAVKKSAPSKKPTKA